MLKGPKVKVEMLMLNTLQRVQKYKRTKECEEQDEVIMELMQIECTTWSGVTLAEMPCGRMEINRTHTAVEMAHKFTEEHGKKEVVLPEEFKRHALLFSDEEAKAFPPSRPWDHKIELKDDPPDSFNCKIYPMSVKEQAAENKFLDENLEKGYITPSDSPYGFSMFMVPKKDTDKMHYIIDYRPLNAVTQHGVTPLPNLSKCIENLQGMELYSKFDVRWGYNNIRI